MQPDAMPVLGVLLGGTDAGSMLIYDPAALPDDYDVHARQDPMAILERMFDDGEVYWLDTAADGGYSLGVRMGSRLPAEMEGVARSLGTASRFNVAGGRLYFTGIEYAFRHDDSFLRKYPHMGSFLEIPAGTYRLTLYEMNYPDDFHEDLLRERLPIVAFRLYSLMRGLIPIGCISAVFLVVSPFLIGTRPCSIAILTLCFAAFLPAFLISRSRMYRDACRLDVAIRREHPDFWATLEIATDPS